MVYGRTRDPVVTKYSERHVAEDSRRKQVWVKAYSTSLQHNRLLQQYIRSENRKPMVGRRRGSKVTRCHRPGTGRPIASSSGRAQPSHPRLVNVQGSRRIQNLDFPDE